MKSSVVSKAKAAPVASKIETKRTAKLADGPEPKRQKTPPVLSLLPPKLPVRPLSSTKVASGPIKPVVKTLPRPLTRTSVPPVTVAASKTLKARLSPRLASKTSNKAIASTPTTSTPKKSGSTPKKGGTPKKNATPKKTNKTPQKHGMSAEEQAAAAVEAMLSSSSSTSSPSSTAINGVVDMEDETFFVDEIGGTYADISARREAQRQRRLEKRRTSVAGQTEAFKTTTKSPARGAKSLLPVKQSPTRHRASPLARQSPSKSPAPRKSPRLASPSPTMPTQVVDTSVKVMSYSPVQKAPTEDVFLLTDGLAVPGLSARHEANRRQRLAQRKGY